MDWTAVGFWEYCKADFWWELITFTHLYTVMLMCSQRTQKCVTVPTGFLYCASLCLFNFYALFTAVVRQPNCNGKHFLIKLLITLALMLEIKAQCPVWIMKWIFVCDWCEQYNWCHGCLQTTVQTFFCYHCACKFVFVHFDFDWCDSYSIMMIFVLLCT